MRQKTVIAEDGMGRDWLSGYRLVADGNPKLRKDEGTRHHQADGWRMVAQEGSHRHYKHPVQKGRVTIPGHFEDDVAVGTLRNIFKQSQLPKES
jgi:predicted RNA binding protein YcfA (HicA-like mRNA interferase family)